MNTIEVKHSGEIGNGNGTKLSLTLDQMLDLVHQIPAVQEGRLIQPASGGNGSGNGGDDDPLALPAEAGKGGNGGSQ